ncbi:MAG: NAD(P)/FAD-dependent oxidoreductase [Kordiimonadaceae bacterium]|nr:NAD(P)/FAD-dependent oxidoreductase [Kordiimonadaceae bacterium]MBO6569174.1 NAD(P)/FAD-dependent oxidoreductase [Kordiimonadaceae bacterium]MBO6964650.1 NAD(P)/FAD-dependent oxidoreductase [Kordiimonadaceae bacterium]
MTNASPTIAIIGAGFSGLCMGIKLKEAGITSFRIFEKANKVGGTWRENTYPGVACDVPSHLYCFSFAPNPDWTKHYSGGAEIQAYIEKCSADHGMEDHLEFGEQLVSANFEDGWNLEFASGRKEKVDFLINGIGGLHVPRWPELEGMDEFAEKAFHSAHWDHEHDLTGRNVAVVGTAASALQLIPEIVDKVKSLTVFQRTPNWVMPRQDPPYSDGQKKRFRKFGWIRKLHRLGIYLSFEGRFPLFRQNKMLQAWARKQALKHLEEQVSDPELRAKLTPDYPVGCKRILGSDEYFPALQKDNVNLVTNPIDRVNSKGIIDATGTHHQVDTIVYATGFKPFSLLEGMEITGPSGQKMSDYFADGGVRAHNTVSVPGFPNFALLTGPNSGLGHNSIILMIEAQVGYIVGCLKAMQRKNAKSIDVKADLSEQYDVQIQRDLQGSVWLSGCKSWYVGADGRNYTLWPWSTLKYRRMMRRVDPNDFSFEV